MVRYVDTGMPWAAPPLAPAAHMPWTTLPHWLLLVDPGGISAKRQAAGPTIAGSTSSVEIAQCVCRITCALLSLP
jgi:hypothetical protein